MPDPINNKPNYEEWETPCGPPGDHFLNQLSNHGYYKTSTMQAATEKAKSSGTSTKAEAASKTKVHVVVNVLNIQQIDLSSETFTCRLRLYVLWSLGKAEDGHECFERFRQKAIDSEHYYPLTDLEVQEFLEQITVPTLKFFNATDIEILDEAPGVRIYGGNEGAILWNCGYIVTLKEYFPLQLFPFDHQELSIELGQDDSRTWDHFDLTVCKVQFHSKALELPEWKMLEPTIQRNKIAHKATTVTLQVKREPAYFVNNIVAIMTMLSLLGMVVFALPADSLNDRVGVILTLLLTAVAFKLVISDSIPKVGYSTLIDRFVLGNMVYLFSTVMLCTAGFLLQESISTLPDECGYSPICLVATQLNHIVSTQGISINAMIFTLSILLFLGINCHWIYTVRHRSKMNMHLRTLLKEDGRNWYSCAFSNPHFLPEPERHP
jgi:hypothetical protein